MTNSTAHFFYNFFVNVRLHNILYIHNLCKMICYVTLNNNYTEMTDSYHTPLRNDLSSHNDNIVLRLYIRLLLDYHPLFIRLVEFLQSTLAVFLFYLGSLYLARHFSCLVHLDICFGFMSNACMYFYNNFGSLSFGK